ncbi:MAG: dihydroorotate dehydrogenase electron transfer subunit [Solirubrobacteraceae bacterium]
MTAPFGRRSAAVVGREEVGAYVVVAVDDPQGRAHPPAPGQFYMLAAAEHWGAGEGERPFLARACSVLDAAGGRLRFLLEDVGPGTRRLSRLRVGEEMWLTGPLGVGFTWPAGPALVVAGGVGIAAVAAVQRAFGCPALLGFRDARHAAGASLLRDASVATDDGSVGHHGLVTELLEAELDRAGDAPPTLYACGPPAMLEAVRALCVRRRIRAELALEAPMACGFGACYGCVVATRDGYRRVCVDGPVFDAAVLEAVA